MAKRSHPIQFAEAMGETAMKEFFVAVVDRDYFDEWLGWLAAIFGVEISAERANATFGALVNAKFTNAELGIAGDWIVTHNERFPVPAHFLACPQLARNAGGPS